MGRGVLGVLSGIALFSALGFGTGAASADPDQAIGQPKTSGNGCPDGTVSTIFSPDHSVLSLLFDSFEVTTAENKKHAFGNCNIIIPLNVKPGHRITGLTIDYRGYAFIPEGGKGRFVSRYEIGPKMVSAEDVTFPGGWDDDFLLTHEFTQPEKPLKLKKFKWMLKHKFLCNEKVKFRIENRFHVEKEKFKSEEEAFGALDSADVAPSVQVGLVTEPCPNKP